MTVPSLTSWTAEIDPGLATLEGVEALDPAATFYWEEPASGSYWRVTARSGSTLQFPGRGLLAPHR